MHLPLPPTHSSSKLIILLCPLLSPSFLSLHPSLLLPLFPPTLSLTGWSWSYLLMLYSARVCLESTPGKNSSAYPSPSLPPSPSPPPPPLPLPASLLDEVNHFLSFPSFFLHSYNYVFTSAFLTSTPSHTLHQTLPSLSSHTLPPAPPYPAPPHSALSPAPPSLYSTLPHPAPLTVHPLTLHPSPYTPSLCTLSPAPLHLLSLILYHSPYPHLLILHPLTLHPLTLHPLTLHPLILHLLTLHPLTPGTEILT